MDGHEVVGQPGQHAGRNRPPVDPGPAATAGRQHPRDHDLSTGHPDAGFAHTVDHPRKDPETPVDAGLVSERPHHRAVGARAEEQLQRLNHQGLARSRLAGDDVQPG